MIFALPIGSALVVLPAITASDVLNFLSRPGGAYPGPDLAAHCGVGDVDIIFDVTGIEASLLSLPHHYELIVVAPSGQQDGHSIDFAVSATPATGPAADGSPTYWELTRTTVFGSETSRFIQFRHTLDERGEWRIGLRIWRDSTSYVSSPVAVRLYAGDGLPSEITI